MGALGSSGKVVQSSAFVFHYALNPKLGAEFLPDLVCMADSAAETR
jgi:hypothetical protein